MSDYSELKRLAEAAGSGEWGYDGSYVCPARKEGGTTYVESWHAVADTYQVENTKFIAAANPAVVLALIAENEALRTQLSEQASISNDLAQEASDANEQIIGLRKDAERYRRIRQGSLLDGEVYVLDQRGCDYEEEACLIDGEALDAVVDETMSKEAL